MTNHYSPENFVRRVSNRLLPPYFHQRNALLEIDFNKRKEAEIKAIYEAWLLLPDDQRNSL